MWRTGIVGAAILVAGAANAADFVNGPQSGFNWGGFYVGIGGGAGTVNHTIDVPPLGGLSFSGLGGSGIFGEATVGYDHMLGSRFLLGAFADFRFGTIGTSLDIPVIPIGLGLDADYGFDVALRAGYLITPRTLGYVLGGYSWQHFDLNVSGAGSVYDWGASGFVVGVGMETVLTGNLTLKSEYRYANYGSEDFNSGGLINADPATHTFHAGLNYRFGASAGGGATFETPVRNWTGFYVGGALGAGGLTHDLSIAGGAIGLDGIGAEGFLGEASVGYDWEFGSRWVVGLMADARYSTVSTELSAGGFGASVDADYGFDILARVGGKLNDATLLYAVGGYSWQHFDIQLGGGSVYDWGASGFTVGAGIETALSDRTTVNLEYRYADYQGEDFGVPGLIDLSPSSHTVRAGLKFKLF